MSEQVELLIWVLIATFIAVLLIYKKLDQKDMNSGLVLLLIANLYLIHYFGALIHTFPWYTEGDISLTLKGFRLTTIGLICFTVGCLVFSPRILGLLPLHKLKGYGTKPNINLKELTDIGLIYFAIGAGCAVIVISRLVLIPSVSGLFTQGILLAVVGACFMCLRSIIRKNIYELIFWICVAIIFPLITIVFSGHIGFGLIWLMIVIFFVIKYINPKRKLFLIGIIGAYFALSFFQTYMRDRDDLRDMIKMKAETSQVIEHVQNSIIEPEFFSPFNPEHLEVIYLRLNQNYLVGEGVEYMSFRNNFVMGQTFVDLFLALVPRIIWPAKPITAGDDDYVFKFTGTFLPDDTSIGLGYVLEFYGNFSVWGVAVGFFILGIFLAVIDYISAFHLRMGNWREFAIWFLPATAFTNPELVLAPIVSTSILTLIVAYGASKIPRNLFKPVLFVVTIAIILGAYQFIFSPLINPIERYFQLFILILISYFVIKYFYGSSRRKTLPKFFK